MKNKIKIITFISIIIIFGIVGSKALFRLGFYTSHDGEHQLVRQYIFDQGLRDGQIPVRFSRQLYNGYGYPLFIFTYRLPFYVGEVFRLAGWSYVDSIKAVFFIAYLASGVTMFWFTRRWGNLAGLIAAILYMWAPYRFSVMFVRAALGEHVALVFIPLLFGSITGGKKARVNWILGAISIAGLFLAHAMMAQIVLPMFLIWLVSHRLFRWRNLLAMFILGLGLAAYYLIPAVAYRGLTQKLNPNYFSDHFVTLRQLIYSPWGYAFSMKGTENDGMSFQVGVAQWAAVGLAVAVFIAMYPIRRLLAVRQGVSLKGSAPVLALILIFVLSLFLMTEKSAFVWNWWKNYINIDMPWRFLAMTTFVSAALGGMAISQISQIGRIGRIGRIGLIVILVGLAVYANRNHLRVNEYLNYPDVRLTEYRGTSNSDNEYRPKWDDAGITRSFLDEAKISTGSGQFVVVRSKSNLLQVAGNFEEDSRVDLNILYFPGWEVMIDGQKWAFKYAGEGGIIRVDVPEGYHMIEAKYKETGLMRFADWISIGSLITLMGLIKTLEH